jgi:hypothetical protein
MQPPHMFGLAILPHFRESTFSLVRMAEGAMRHEMKNFGQIRWIGEIVREGCVLWLSLLD